MPTKNFQLGNYFYRLKCTLTPKITDKNNNSNKYVTNAGLEDCTFYPLKKYSMLYQVTSRSLLKIRAHFFITKVFEITPLY